MDADSIHVWAALDTLRRAGFSVAAPSSARLHQMTVTEVAELLKFDRRTVQRWIDAGEFPGARMFGTDIRIPVSDVESFIARRPAAARPVFAEVAA